MHRVKHNAHICTDKNDTSFALDKYQKLLIIPPTSEKCLAPCHQLDIHIRGESFGKIDLTIGNLTQSIFSILNFQKWIKERKEKLLYTELSLFAEIGGYVGIVLGYSLLNLADNIYNFFKTRWNK